MEIYNAICIHNAYNHFLPSHLGALAKLGRAVSPPCLYYGDNGQPPAGWEDKAVRLGLTEVYDNLALKTYAMLRHALLFDGWTHFFKTDVNSIVHTVDWEAVASSEYAGLVITPRPDGAPYGGRVYGNHLRQPILREPYLGKMAHFWCGGSGYFIGRRLAVEVVGRGAWAARGYFAEDNMVGVVAEEIGIIPAPAVAYGHHSKFVIHPA